MRIAILLVLMLTGCVTSKLRSDLQPYVGRNVSELTHSLGYPTSVQDMMGGHVYVWALSFGTIDMRGECRLHVATTMSDVVTGYSWEGNLIGCAQFHEQLDR